MHHTLAMIAKLRRVATFLSPLVLVAGSLSPAAASPAGGYYDGLIDYSTITNCVSIIQGAPYVEKGAGAYAGVYHDPDAGVPAVGQTVYMHVVIHGLGNACSGQYFVPSVGWDVAGLQFDQTQPIYCYNSDGQVSGADCPQWGDSRIQFGAGPGGSMRYFANNPTKGNMWPLSVGKAWEFQFPIKPTTAKTNATIHTFFEMADGNDNVTLTPKASLYTFGPGTPPSVMYDLPSTTPGAVGPDGTTPMRFGLVSRAHLNVQGQGGALRMQIGTKSGTYPDTVALSLGAGYTSVDLWTDWDEPGVPDLVPGKRYFWRAGFVPSGGSAVWGKEQSFVVPTAQTCLGRDVTVALSLGGSPTDGDDVIMGTSGADKISAGLGNDVICSGGGSDIVDGGDGHDIVDSGGGNDLVYGLVGDDALRGGAGTDTVSYAGATASVVLKLAQATEQNTGMGLDIITGFENAVGGNLGDSLTGTGGPNVLSGLGGGDTLKAQGGKDKLVGGKGNDTCAGGTGKDKATTCEHTSSIP